MSKPSADDGESSQENAANMTEMNEKHWISFVWNLALRPHRPIECNCGNTG